MSGIAVPGGNAETRRYPIICHKTPQGEATFLVLADGEIGLATQDYVLERISRVEDGELRRLDAWDRLMIFTADMEIPAQCFWKVEAGPDKRTVVFRSGLGMGPIRLRADL